MKEAKEAIDRLIGVAIIYMAISSFSTALSTLLEDPILQIIADLALLAFGILLATGKLRIISREVHKNGSNTSRFFAHM